MPFNRPSKKQEAVSYLRRLPLPKLRSLFEELTKKGPLARSAAKSRIKGSRLSDRDKALQKAEDTRNLGRIKGSRLSDRDIAKRKATKTARTKRK